MNKLTKQYYKKISILLGVVVLGWLLLDRVTKMYFDSGQFSINQNISGSILGLFHFTLVHNSGAAFGIFSDMSAALAVGSIAISIFLIALPFAMTMRIARNDEQFRLSITMLLSVAVIVAGGIGNAIDRFVSGYVVDFICLDFMAFPVFNIADIGVVVGMVVLVINCFIFFRDKSPDR